MKRSVVSVSPISEHPEWMLKIKNNRIIPNINFKSFSSMSQKLEKLYKINGLGYLITSKDIVSQKTLSFLKIQFLVFQVLNLKI